jgi:hypothetical protein
LKKVGFDNWATNNWFAKYKSNFVTNKFYLGYTGGNGINKKP